MCVITHPLSTVDCADSQFASFEVTEQSTVGGKHDISCENPVSGGTFSGGAGHHSGAVSPRLNRAICSDHVSTISAIAMRIPMIARLSGVKNLLTDMLLRPPF